MRVPSTIINDGVPSQGKRSDGVTCVVYLLSAKFENLEDERQLTSGTALIDVRVDRGERVASVLARFDMAGLEADPAGFNTPSFNILTLILFRTLGVGIPERRNYCSR
eukprot:4994011-Pyramimonas_sp.AAC.1